MKYFITFAAGNQDYINAGNRIINQAKNTKLFDKHIFYNEKYLQNNNTFWNLHKDFILKNKRGFGYWLWKPFIILQTFNLAKNGDTILYLDSGCEINYKNTTKINNLKNYLNIIKNYKIIGTTTCKEKEWNKMDLILHLNLLDDKYLETPQRCGGTNLFYVCDETRKIVQEWYNLACNYHFIDDSPSQNQNYNCFKEHRHDQSIFSLLLKKYNLCNNCNLRTCIEIARNRTGKSRFI